MESPGVYPRVCGGTINRMAAFPQTQGLSPRMRGNHALSAGWSTPTGSIPAYAGEPEGIRRRRLRNGVYPRVCGGTWSSSPSTAGDTGLSPRMRGNLVSRGWGWGIAGSIPAYAGEPSRGRGGSSVHPVYPRVCGGTAFANSGAIAPKGLSPRMRGNPTPNRQRAGPYWSIPAYAGEPKRKRGRPAGGRVYPRVCGGTPVQGRSRWHLTGLSPRMRGNPISCLHYDDKLGSIPAYAGEPRSRVQEGSQFTVYPRVCGGTGHIIAAKAARAGLSPRMRGNPHWITRQECP